MGACRESLIGAEAVLHSIGPLKKYGVELYDTWCDMMVDGRCSPDDEIGNCDYEQFNVNSPMRSVDLFQVTSGLDQSPVLPSCSNKRPSFSVLPSFLQLLPSLKNFLLSFLPSFRRAGELAVLMFRTEHLLTVLICQNQASHPKEGMFMPDGSKISCASNDAVYLPAEVLEYPLRTEYFVLECPWLTKRFCTGISLTDGLNI